eukprot:TRINITY_DN89_c0_g1_i2.p1 TRINITY_DN89_c0_g1~~TRINITY_DN89_c0_g1_i2.p1  ORF type:complete len:203 (-),score=30.79 TRINITY_DN89_c0_g1_i2:160-768(-)
MPHMMGMILKISAPTSFVAARAPPPPLALLVALTLAATCANFSSTETGEDRTLPEAAMGFSPAKLAIRATALGDDLQATRAPLPAALQTGEHSPAESVTEVAIATGTSCCCCRSLPLTAADCRKPRHWEEEGGGQGEGRGVGEGGKRRNGYGQSLAKAKTGKVFLCVPQPYFERIRFLLFLSLPPLSLSLSLPVSVPLHSHK